MRVTVDIDEKSLATVMKLTGEGNKGPALTKAVHEFIRRRKLSEFGRMIRESAFDYPDERANDSITNPIPPARER
ncbi:MAG TPA: type II toxin-antitoxin system VapB family antitoxin [Kiritimatiellia bacterium]|nr:type II toxin-antitoxin system VapB family antitoxin [Kiritimatiellia bacterium]HMP34217.1 type II toxin-antitoxin system VapB family antitoxin [Kiritimatiellia bacterium]